MSPLGPLRCAACSRDFSAPENLDLHRYLDHDEPRVAAAPPPEDEAGDEGEFERCFATALAAEGAAQEGDAIRAAILGAVASLEATGVV